MQSKQELYDAKKRWEETRVKQFSFTNNLFLTLAVGALGFAVSLPIDSEINFACEYPHCASGSYWLSVLLFLVSILLGIACTITRLRDFRESARRDFLRYNCGQSPVKDKRGISHYVCSTKELGKCSWCLLRWQIFIFALGVMLFTAAMVTWKFHTAWDYEVRIAVSIFVIATVCFWCFLQEHVKDQVDD